MTAISGHVAAYGSLGALLRTREAARRPVRVQSRAAGAAPAARCYRRQRVVRCASSIPPSSGEDGLSAEFGKLLQGRCRRPAAEYALPAPALMPEEVVETVVCALQACDYPEVGAGVQLALRFSLRRADLQLFSTLGQSQRVSSAAAVAADTGDTVPASSSQEDGANVLGWVPRRTRIRAPDHDPIQFERTLRAEPYRALIEGDRVDVGVPAMNPNFAECEVPVVAVEGGEERELVFRLHKPERGRDAGCWLIKHVHASWDPTNYR